ncbi:MAG: hypothetical protein ACP5G1_02935 [Nanopusillaceae archaeon]
MARRQRKLLKDVILELLKSPKTVDELVKSVKSKRPRTRVRVIKALLTRLVKEGAVRKVGDKFQA